MEKIKKDILTKSLLLDNFESDQFLRLKCIINQNYIAHRAGSKFQLDLHSYLS